MCQWSLDPVAFLSRGCSDLARLTRAFWPPLSVAPLSPITVMSPSGSSSRSCNQTQLRFTIVWISLHQSQNAAAPPQVLKSFIVIAQWSPDKQQLQSFKQAMVCSWYFSSPLLMRRLWGLFCTSWGSALSQKGCYCGWFQGIPRVVGQHTWPDLWLQVFQNHKAAHPEWRSTGMTVGNQVQKVSAILKKYLFQWLAGFPPEATIARKQARLSTDLSSPNRADHCQKLMWLHGDGDTLQRWSVQILTWSKEKHVRLIPVWRITSRYEYSPYPNSRSNSQSQSSSPAFLPKGAKTFCFQLHPAKGDSGKGIIDAWCYIV